MHFFNCHNCLLSHLCLNYFSTKHFAYGQYCDRYVTSPIWGVKPSEKQIFCFFLAPMTPVLRFFMGSVKQI